MKITVDGKIYEYAAGTLLGDIAADFEKESAHDIVLVTVDGKLRELHHRQEHDAEIKFVTTACNIGNSTYKRSCSMLFLAAAYHIAGHENIRKAVLHFTIDDGFYYTIDGNVRVNEDFMRAVEAEMHRLVDTNCPIGKRNLPTDEARKLFHRYGMYDKEKLFRTRLSSSVNIYTLDGFEDYNYGFMTSKTGYLRYFKLFLYQGGIVLKMPSADKPEEVEDFHPLDNLFRTQIMGEEWAEDLKIDTVGALNEEVINANTRQTILISEAVQESRIASIAEEICAGKGVKFVMVAGPSSSGKTTFSQRLCVQLSAHGLRPHYVGVDNYFLDRTLTPLDKNGQRNFECLEALDVKKFNEDMTALLNGDTIKTPSYDFIEGKRVYNGEKLTLPEGEILVIEGIHCLNDELSYSLPRKSKFKIYISALTQLNIDEHNRIPTTDGRLIRRIVRDYRTRGYSAANTLSMWNSVRRGEEENIFPYQETADVFFNSALLYELAVLKLYAQPLLFQVPQEHPQYEEAKRLLKFLDYFIGVPSDDVPHNSILREFVGGGCFRL